MAWQLEFTTLAYLIIGFELFEEQKKGNEKKQTRRRNAKNVPCVARKM